MSAGSEHEQEDACAACLRRSWLLSELSALLDYNRGRVGRLRELLALPDEQLIDALAGSRRQSLHAAYRRYEPDAASASAGARTLCRHRALYPQALKDELPSAALYLGGEMSQLSRLLNEPLVAILGSEKPSDYGMRMASRLARGLAACGITVISRLRPGIANAAHRGALQLQAGTLAIASSGLGQACSGSLAPVCEAVMNAGCALTELPPAAGGHGWGSVAGERVLLGLASLVVLVEAEQSCRDLSTARRAIELGRPVVAVPGSVDSPLAQGPLELLIAGARLIRGPHDILELLYKGDTAAAESSLPPLGAGLPERLRQVLELVRGGRDTPEMILGHCASPGEALAALSELEIAGVVVRGPGGRYLPGEDPSWAPRVSYPTPTSQ